MQTKPKLRFKEFNNNWNNFALKEFCIINPNNNKTLPNKFFYIDLESVINGQIACKLNAINKDNAPSRAARILQVNDLLYQTVRPYQRNNYLFSNELELPTVASTGYAQMRTTKNSIKFLYQLIHTDEFVNNVMKRCTGTSYPAINSTDLSNIIISVPNIEEQEKVAGFLSKVDELINECESEVKDLEEQKKGLMQKIFSQQIRFKDSNNNPYPDWEEVQLNTFATLINGRAYKQNELLHTGKYPVLRVGNFFTNGDWYYSNLQLEPDKYAENGDLLYAWSASFGPRIWMGEKVIYHYHIWKISLKKNVDKLFLLYLLEQDVSALKVQMNGGIMMHITKENMENRKFILPCLEEQEKIAKVLSKMDELIEEKKALLSDWQQFKKGLLQQMFV